MPEAIAELIILATKVDSMTNLGLPAPRLHELEELSNLIVSFESRLPEDGSTVIQEILERLECYQVLLSQMMHEEFQNQVGGFW